MSKRFRVGIVGFGQMHINKVAALFARHSQVDMVCCADTRPTIPELRVAPYTRQWNHRYVVGTCGIGKDWGEEWEKMLQSETPDIVICCSETSRHPDVVEACASAGAAVVVEKPMAVSLDHARRMARATRKAGTAMLVNWPTTWEPAFRRAQELVSSGEIGRVLEIKMRLGHGGPFGAGEAHAGIAEKVEPMSGEERGATWWHRDAESGGALVDFCSYGGLICRWYLGEVAVSALGMQANLDSPWSNAIDNALVLLRFGGALGLLEGSWTTLDNGVPGGPIVYGTTGTLVVESREGEHFVRVERGHGRSVAYESPALPAGREQVAGEMIHHLETGEPLHPTLDRDWNSDNVAMIDAGVRSSRSGKFEPVDTGCGSQNR